MLFSCLYRRKFSGNPLSNVHIIASFFLSPLLSSLALNAELQPSIDHFIARTFCVLRNVIVDRPSQCTGLPSYPWPPYVSYMSLPIFRAPVFECSTTSLKCNTKEAADKVSHFTADLSRCNVHGTGTAETVNPIKAHMNNWIWKLKRLQNCKKNQYSGWRQAIDWYCYGCRDICSSLWR